MIDRVRAEEILDWIPAHSAAMGGDHVKSLIEDLRRRVGNPLITETRVMPKADKELAMRLFGPSPAPAPQ